MDLNNVLIIIFLFLFLLLTVLVLASMAKAYFSAAPWCPTKKRDWDRIIKAGGIKKGDVVYDFGSGTGCVASYVGKKTGATVIGLELSMPFYIWSKIRNKLFGVGNVQIKNENFFKCDISDADCIFCFLTPKAMNKLGEKFKRELNTGAMVVSYVFKIPDWNPIEIDSEGGSGASIYIYKKVDKFC